MSAGLLYLSSKTPIGLPAIQLLASATALSLEWLSWGRPCCSAAEGGEDLIDHERRLEERLEDRSNIIPERVCLLPEVDERTKDTETVDSPSTSGTCAA